MIEERSTRLLEQLERRGAALLDVLRDSRVQQDAQHTRLAELERRRAELEARCNDLEASRLELAEENRELDAQNRELEAHNHRLLERDPAAEASSPLFHRQARRAQGLSALIGHRPQPSGADDTATRDAESAAAEPPSSTPSPSTAPRPSPETQDEAPSPQALLDQWYRRYAATFFKGHTRPLKVGIHEELAAREPWPEKLVRRALACYVNLPRYLKSVRKGAERLDLAGEPAGQVDDAAAEHARKKLERLQTDRGRARPARRRGKGQHGPVKGETPSGEAAGHDDAPIAPPSARQDLPAAPPGSGPAGGGAETLEEKLSALLAKHNQR